MYVIIKIIAGNNYWWNDEYKRWEGLKDNATVFYQDADAAKAINKNRLGDLADISL